MKLAGVAQLTMHARREENSEPPSSSSCLAVGRPSAMTPGLASPPAELRLALPPSRPATEGSISLLLLPCPMDEPQSASFEPICKPVSGISRRDEGDVGGNSGSFEALELRAQAIAWLRCYDEEAHVRHRGIREKQPAARNTVHTCTCPLNSPATASGGANGKRC